MLGIHELWLFVISGLLLNVTPGPDMPQFVATDSPYKAAAFALLGLVFILNGTLWCLGVAVFAAGAAGRIRKSNRAFAWINRSLGGMFVYLGVRVAMAQSR